MLSDDRAHRQQAIVRAPHARVSIRGQVLCHRHDPGSVFVMRQQYTDEPFLHFPFFPENPPQPYKVPVSDTISVFCNGEMTENKTI